MSEPEKTGQQQVERDESGKFVPGVSGNPEGRPKGKFSIKTRIIQRLESNPQELKTVIDYLIKNERALLFQMIDGRPPQKIDGDVVMQVKQIYNGQSLPRHNSDTQDISTQEED